MHDEYYGAPSTPTSDYLAHYGVRGMKWGVRKAIESGSERKLSRQFNKAAKKLAKLQNEANAEYQKKRVKNASHHQKVSAALGAANLGVAAGVTAHNIRKAIASGKRYATMALPVGAGIAAVDIAARQIGKRKAKKLVTDVGHKEAVRKANEFRNEMQKSFKGTSYAKQINSTVNDIAAKKRRRIEYKTARY